MKEVFTDKDCSLIYVNAPLIYADIITPQKTRIEHTKYGDFKVFYLDN